MLRPLLPPARRLSLVGALPGANVKSHAGYLTVNKKYNSNLFFWFFPAQAVSCPALQGHTCREGAWGGGHRPRTRPPSSSRLVFFGLGRHLRPPQLCFLPPAAS